MVIVAVNAAQPYKTIHKSLLLKQHFSSYGWSVTQTAAGGRVRRIGSHLPLAVRCVGLHAAFSKKLSLSLVSYWRSLTLSISLLHILQYRSHVHFCPRDFPLSFQILDLSLALSDGSEFYTCTRILLHLTDVFD